LHSYSWAHPNADGVPSRLGIGGRFRAMLVELVGLRGCTDPWCTGCKIRILIPGGVKSPHATALTWRWLANTVKVSPARRGSTSTSYRPRPFMHHHTAGAEPNSSGHGMQPTVSHVQLVSSPARMRLLSSGNHLSSRSRFPCSWAHPNADSVPI
jgi:hypothetical protein